MTQFESSLKNQKDIHAFQSTACFFFFFFEFTYQKNWAWIWRRVNALIINFDNSIAKTGTELVGLLKYS